MTGESQARRPIPRTCRHPQAPRPARRHAARPPHQRGEPADADGDRLLSEHLARRRINRGDRVRALVCPPRARSSPSSTSSSTGWTPGGHGLLWALPRIYQVTPDIPDRRRATQQKEVRPPADSLKESQLAARSGTSLQRRTSPTSRITTASFDAALRLRAGG